MHDGKGAETQFALPQNASILCAKSKKAFFMIILATKLKSTDQSKTIGACCSLIDLDQNGDDWQEMALMVAL